MNQNTESVKYYDFAEISAATDGFSDANKFGQGQYGTVYRGRLPDGQEIAVKTFSSNPRHYKNEFSLVPRLQHRNVVRLFGFSEKGNERFLVYELVQNASLDKFLFDPIKRSYLKWEILYKIIKAVASGLLYLHEESALKISHGDVKASNILLEEDWNPKISDFGFASEFHMYGGESDVYNFGVLILEIISGHRKKHFQRGEKLLPCAWKYWNENTPTYLIDQALKDSSGTLDEMLRCIHIGLLCVQAVDAPKMDSVVSMLNGLPHNLPVCSEPSSRKSSCSCSSCYGYGSDYDYGYGYGYGFDDDDDDDDNDDDYYYGSGSDYDDNDDDYYYGSGSDYDDGEGADSDFD